MADRPRYLLLAAMATMSIGGNHLIHVEEKRQHQNPPLQQHDLRSNQRPVLTTSEGQSHQEFANGIFGSPFNPSQ